MIRELKPSRLLNEKRGFLGLSMIDFGAAIGVFVLSTSLLEGSKYQIVSFFLAAALLLILSPVRLKTRRKILRDLLSYQLMGKVVNDPRKK